MEKSGALLLLFLGLLATTSQTVWASDPDLTTDFGISSPVAANFTFTFFPKDQPKGKATPTFASFDTGLPGLTGLGLTAVLFQFGPYSQINPHTHPRATELFYVIDGCVDVGFVDTNNDLFEITLQAGQLFVFPKGLLHFQANNQNYKATGYSVLSSENPGVLMIANALFTASGTGLPDNVLEVAFGSTAYTVDGIKKSLGDPPSQGY